MSRLQERRQLLGQETGTQVVTPPILGPIIVQIKIAQWQRQRIEDANNAQLLLQQIGGQRGTRIDQGRLHSPSRKASHRPDHRVSQGIAEKKEILITNLHDQTASLLQAQVNHGTIRTENGARIRNQVGLKIKIAARLVFPSSMIKTGTVVTGD